MTEMLQWHNLPPELVHEIIKELPIDPACLMALAASSRVLAATVLTDARFANIHIRYCLLRSKAANLWEYLNAENIRDGKWLSLPFSYKVGLFMELLTADPWEKAELVDDMANNLMYFERWRVDGAGALKIAAALLDLEFDITRQLNRLFRWAARAGYLDVVNLLLQHDKVNPADDDNYALKCSSETGEVEVVKLLLADPRCDPSAEDNIALQYACDFARADVVRLLLDDDRVDVLTNDNYCLIRSCTIGHLEILEMLLNAGVNPSVEDDNALRHTCKEGFVDLARLLLQHPKVDPAVLFNAPIRLASQYGHCEIVELLLANSRVQPEDEDSSALALACENGHFDIVQALIEDGRSDVNSFNGFCILSAASNKHWDIVEYLLGHSKVDATVQENMLLIQAIEGGKLEIIKFLLESQPNVDPSVRNQYPLLVASECGFAEAVELLLEDPRVSQAAQGDLFPAFEAGLLGGFSLVVKAFLENQTVEPNFGHLQMARYSKNDEIIRLVEEAYITHVSNEVQNLDLINPLVPTPSNPIPNQRKVHDIEDEEEEEENQ